MVLKEESVLPQSPMNETVYDRSSHKALAYRDARGVALTDSHYLSKEMYNQCSNFKTPLLAGAIEQSWKKCSQDSQSSDYAIKVSWPSANVEAPAESASAKVKAVPVHSPYASPPPEQFGIPDSRHPKMHSGITVRTRNKRIRDFYFKCSLDIFDISPDFPSNVPQTSPRATSSDLSYSSSPLLYKTSNTAIVISTSSNTKFSVLNISNISDNSHEKHSAPERNLFLFQGLSADFISAINPSDRESSSSLSDISDSDDDKDIQNPIVLQIIHILCNILLKNYRRFVLNKTPCKIKQQASGEPRPSEVETRRQLSSKRTSDNNKRKQDNSVDRPDNEDNSTEHKRPQLNFNTHVNSKKGPFACPFYKFDITLFGPTSPDEKYHGCI